MFYIHVNKNTIASNKKNGTANPAVRIQEGKYGKPVYCSRVRFTEGEMIYQPSGDALLPCGARLAIVTKHKPTILE